LATRPLSTSFAYGTWIVFITTVLGFSFKEVVILLLIAMGKFLLRWIAANAETG
jgi:hypothetical protein